jgi:hypothetical protein
MAAPRLCSRTFQIVCQNCCDSAECIPPIDMVGRVVTVQGKQLYFAPCCARIQEYAGTGRDFAPREHWEGGRPCQHALKQSAGTGKSGQPKGRQAKHSCFVWNCQAQAGPRAHTVVDHVEGTLETVHLCYKHTPPEELLRRAKNFKQLCDTCKLWDSKQRSAHKKGNFNKRCKR